jgi:hypothetical protein
VARGDDAREVEQRPRRRRHRHAAHDGELVARKRRAVQRDAGPRPQRTTDRDVGRSSRTDAQVPQRGSRAMAEDGARSRGEDRRHPAPLSRDGAVTDGVHAAMQGVEAAAGQPMADRAPAEPQVEELTMGDDAVLALGERRDRCVVCDTQR